MSFGQKSPVYKTPSLLSPIRIILDQDTGAFFTWEQEQQIIAKIIYKNIYKDDLQAAISLYVEESNKHNNTKQQLDLQRKQLAQRDADLILADARLRQADKLKTSAEAKYIREEKRKRRWRRAQLPAVVVGFVFGFLLAK